MTARAEYVLSCDAPGCDETFTAGLRRVDKTRADARPHGWTYRVVPQRQGLAKPLDLCRLHGEAL